MKSTFTGFCALGLLALSTVGAAFAEDAKPKSEVTLGSDADKMSYAIGVQLGTRFQSDGISGENINIEMLANGIKDVLAGKEPALDQQGIMDAMMTLQKIVTEGMEAKSSANKTESEAFLATNKEKEGVKVTASGLQYEVIKEGEGANPSPTSQVKVHYKGTLINGTTFDSSYDRGEPATFGLNQVIPGWTEGLQLMKPGAHYRFVIPSDLAYGAQGQGPIPPSSTLVFEVELLEVL